MGRWRRTTPCERAAQWSSLELDGELAELEAAALRRHLDRCPDCAGWHAASAAVTALIRAAPPASRREPVVVVPLARHRVRRRRAVALLALAATLGAGALVAFLPSPAPLQSSALAFASPAQRRQFAIAEHIRIDPHLPERSPAPAAPPRLLPSFADYAARAPLS